MDPALIRRPRIFSHRRGKSSANLRQVPPINGKPRGYPEESDCHGMCSIQVTVTRLRLQLAALGTAAAILIMTAAPLAQALYQTCMLPHHECGKTARIVKCCCGDQDASRNDSTPVQSRLEVRGDMTVASVVPNVTRVVSQLASFAPVDSSPPRLCLLDLPTLFVTFLI